MYSSLLGSCGVSLSWLIQLLTRLCSLKTCSCLLSVFQPLPLPPYISPPLPLLPILSPQPSLPLTSLLSFMQSSECKGQTRTVPLCIWCVCLYQWRPLSARPLLQQGGELRQHGATPPVHLPSNGLPQQEFTDQ